MYMYRMCTICMCNVNYIKLILTFAGKDWSDDMFILVTHSMVRHSQRSIGLLC